VKRLLAVVAGLALVLVGTMAAAAWLSSGSGTASAAATTVDKANPPDATRVASTVSLSWVPSTLASGDAVTGYEVYRHVGPTATLICTVTSASCVDTTPVATQVSYGVVATIGTSWRGPESDLTPFTYDDVAPSTTADVSPAPNAAGWNKAPGTVTVSLEADDSGSTPSAGVDHISHTVDGGSAVVVNAASTSFPVSGAGTHTVTYFAVDNAGNAEDAHTLTVKIDPNAPVTAVVQSPAANNAGWNHDDVTLDFTATDSGTSGIKSVTVDGVPTAGAAASKTLTAEGTHTVSYFATDNADNVEGTKTATVKIDKTAPTTSVDPASSSSWTTDNSVALTANDALSGVASIEYRVDGGPTQTYSTPFTLAGGSHTVEYRATDVAGNVPLFQSATIKVDTVVPTASLSQTGSGQPTISGTDATSGVASVSWRDGNTGGYTTVAGSSTTLSLANGSHTIWYFATDNAGNQSTPTSQTITVNVDTTGPTVTNIDPSNGKSGQNWNQVDCNAVSGRICANVSDTSGVASVTYCLQRVSSGLFWNGTSFSLASCTPRTMSLDSGTRYVSETIANSSVPSGSYRLVVTATDSAPSANVTVSPTITFTIN